MILYIVPHVTFVIHHFDRLIDNPKHCLFMILTHVLYTLLVIKHVDTLSEIN